MAVSSPRVLVVDDEKAIRDVLVDFLSLEGFVVGTAENGALALEALEKQPYDLILSDLKMPSMGGLELLEKVQERHLEALTVIMTGFGTVESAIHAMKRGAFDYVLKPFKVEEVVHIVQRGIDQQRLKLENMQLKEMVHHYQLGEALGGAASLESILSMICDLTIKELNADAVSLVLEDPNHPGVYLLDATRTAHDRIDPAGLEPDVAEVMASVLAHQPVLFHDSATTRFVRGLSDPTSLHSFMAAPLKVRGLPIGLLNVFSFKKGVRFNEGQRKTLAMMASKAAQAIDNSRLFGNLKNTFRQTIQGLAHALEAKDKYTAGHSDRVTAFARCITNGLPELNPDQVDLICQAGLMHDIGKIGIRNEDLNKPDKLTQKEYHMFQSHPSYGKHILEPIVFLHDIIPGVYHHHEMWDGSGYPDKLKGEDIPLMARILSIADTYDAMCSDRAYRKSLPHEVARQELARCGGRQFDPKLIGIFLENIETWRKEQIAAGKPVPA